MPATHDKDLRLAISAVPQPLAIMHAVRDEDGTIVDFEWDHINAAGAAEILVDADTLIGQRLLERLPSHRDGLFDLYVNLVETGEPFELTEAGYDDTWGTQDVIPLIYDIRAIKFHDGFAVWWTDVTERVRSRLELSEMARAGHFDSIIIESSPVGMALVDPTGRFTRVNPAFAEISGHAGDSLIGKTFGEITHPDDLDADLSLVEQLVRREIDSYVMDKRYLRPDGEVVWIRLQGSGVWNEAGELVTFIAQIANIDREKALIQRLRHSNSELQHFAYVASHDLKAPLRHVGIYAELLTNSLGAEATQEQLEHSKEIMSAVDSMRALVDDLLDFSRLSAVQADSSSVKLAQVLHGAAAQVQPSADEVGAVLTVECAADLIVRGNHTQYSRVFTNLIGNAVKYRSPERPCRIDVRARAVQSLVRIEVRDTGVGIPPELVEKAFTMFQRLQTEGEGTGIGLALVRKLIDLNGGQVRIDSDGRTGTTVTVDLPS